MATESPPLLSPEEYERRKQFLEQLKGLTKSEYSEILRILQKHKTVVSENHNGTFFNLCLLEQAVFDDLIRFIQFTQSNKKTLADRELFLSTLVTTESPVGKSEG
jgi:hypothetical protein